MHEDRLASPNRESPGLAQFVSEHLDTRADAITELWLGVLVPEAEAQTSPTVASSRLREQVPDVVRSIAEFTRSPVDQARSAVVHRLRLHADRRRRQGYDIQQLFTEYEILSKLVFEAFSEAVRSYAGPCDAGDVADVAGRLREALMEITSEAVGMYRQRELEQRREVGNKLSDFGATISHELKNPLGAARAGTQFLQDESTTVTSEQRDRFTALILRNLVRMQGLIDDIRVLTLASDGQGTERWVGIGTVVEQVFAELRDSANERGVSLEASTGLLDARVDATRVEIILINLLGNAVKYSDRRKRRRWVRVSAEPAMLPDTTPDTWRITVEDNGLGIPRHAHASVFRRYFRAHPQVAEGTGFGLAIVHELVTARGGRVWFESDEDRGTTFHFLVATREPNDQPLPVRRANSLRRPPASTTSPPR